MALDDKKIHQIEHAAIGSWAGYIYQGVCAAIESVRLLCDNDDCDYILSLEAYEDFAILDSNCKIVSFHQCKDIKTKKDYIDALDLMIDVKEYYDNASITAQSARMFFHCNNLISIDAKYSIIELYTFPGGSNTCKPGDVFDKLKEIIRSYFEKKGITSLSPEIASAILSEKIENSVLQLQQKYFDLKNIQLKDIVRRESKIRLQEIKNLITNPSLITVDENNFFTYTKQNFLNNLIARFNQETEYACSIEEEYPHKQKIEKIIHFIEKMDEKKWMKVSKRISPDLKITVSGNCLTSVASSDRANNLYKIIENIDDDSFDEDLYLKKDATISASTVSDGAIRPEIICKNIYDAQCNADILFEIRWIVALIGNTITSISSALPKITSAPPVKEDEEVTPSNYSIFNPKNNGLLSVEDYNENRY